MNLLTDGLIPRGFVAALDNCDNGVIKVEGIALKSFSDPLLDIQRRQFDCTLIRGFNLTILRHEIDKLYVWERLFRMCSYGGEKVSGDQACDQPKACSSYHHHHPSEHAAKIRNEPEFRGQGRLAKLAL